MADQQPVEVNIDLTTLTTTLQNANQIMSTLVTVLQAAFPQASASTSGSAIGGAATLPANPVAFLTVTVGSTAYKIPLYS